MGDAASAGELCDELSVYGEGVSVPVKVFMLRVLRKRRVRQDITNLFTESGLRAFDSAVIESSEELQKFKAEMYKLNTCQFDSMADDILERLTMKSAGFWEINQ